MVSPVPDAALPHIQVVAAVIEQEGKYLITQRRVEAVLPGLWEFPGGRVDRGESSEDALCRALRERLGVECLVGDQVGKRHHCYEKYQVTLSLFEVSLPPSAAPVKRRVGDFRWVESSEFGHYQFPAADQKTMDLLLGFH